MTCNPGAMFSPFCFIHRFNQCSYTITKLASNQITFHSMMNIFHKIGTKIAIRRYYVCLFNSTKFDGQIDRKIDSKFNRKVKRGTCMETWRQGQTCEWIILWTWPGIIIIRKCRRINNLLQYIAATKTYHARNRLMLQIPQLACSISYNAPF